MKIVIIKICFSVRHVQGYNSNVGVANAKISLSLLNVKRRRTVRQTTREEHNGILSDDEDCNILTNGFESDEENDKSNFEELPLTIATPAKRQRLMFFSVATPSTVISKSDFFNHYFS